MSRGRAREFTKDERMQELVSDAIDDGWIPEITSGGHIRFIHPIVDSPIFAPSSPSDYRSVKNSRSQLNSALKQAQDEALSSREAARAADDRMVEAGRRPLVNCPACRGQGKDKSFMSAEALVVHMGKVHPAAPLEQPEPEPPTPTTDVEMPEEAPMPSHAHGPTVDEFLVYLEETQDPGLAPEEQSPFTIDDVLEYFELPNTTPNRKAVVNRVQTLLRRKDSPIKALERGVYARSNGDDSEETTIKPEPGEIIDPSPSPHRLYEWVADTTDGRCIVKDDSGKAYFATFEEL